MSDLEIRGMACVPAAHGWVQIFQGEDGEFWVTPIVAWKTIGSDPEDGTHRTDFVTTPVLASTGADWDEAEMNGWIRFAPWMFDRPFDSGAHWHHPCWEATKAELNKMKVPGERGRE